MKNYGIRFEFFELHFCVYICNTHSKIEPDNHPKNILGIQCTIKKKG